MNSAKMKDGILKKARNLQSDLKKQDEILDNRTEFLRKCVKIEWYNQ